MIVTSEVVRIMGVWVRRTDAGLALGAARNAAVGMAETRARRHDEVRTLRDLDAVLPRLNLEDGAWSAAADHAGPHQQHRTGA